MAGKSHAQSFIVPEASSRGVAIVGYNARLRLALVVYPKLRSEAR